MEEIRSKEQELKEIREAIAAGEAVLRPLKAAQDSMDSARGWGIFDMLAGGLFSSLVKHSKIDEGSRHLEEAKEKLAAFSRELRDVSDIQELDFQIDGFARFIDVWMDNFFMDWAVQSQIADSQEEIKSAIFRINQMILDLKGKERELEGVQSA